jgi:DNA-binding XRE family transcriptional regulator
MSKNALKEIRESLMMSKAELVKMANISLKTIYVFKTACLAEWKQSENLFWH